MIVELPILGNAVRLVVQVYVDDPELEPSVGDWSLVLVGANELDRTDITERAHPELVQLIDEELTRRGVEAFGLLDGINAAAEAAREEQWGL